MSRIAPANCTPVKTRKATNPKTRPTNAWVKIATTNGPRGSAAASVGTVCATTKASKNASPSRTWIGICTPEKTGTSASMIVMRMNTKSSVSKRASERPKRSKFPAPLIRRRPAGVCGRPLPDELRNAAEDARRESGEHRQHERTEEQNRNRRDEDLRDERQRLFLDLRHGLKDRDAQAGNEAQDQHRRGDDERGEDRFAAQGERGGVTHLKLMKSALTVR